ncbi:MAG: FMN-binding protein, partial [Lachnospiraceae bacterium]|nr:FMN-binding protein [Lachnospiraceae bacterium]
VKTGAAAENEIDAISGATITTKAVTNAVNAGLCFSADMVVSGIGGAGNE